MGAKTPTETGLNNFGLCLCYIYILNFGGAPKVGATAGSGRSRRRRRHGGALLRSRQFPLAPYRSGCELLRWLRHHHVLLGWLRRHHAWLRRRWLRMRMLLLQDLLVIDGAHQGGGMLAGMHDDLAGSVAVREHPVHLDVTTGAGARGGGLK